MSNDNAMKLIGYWIESLTDDKYPPPQGLVQDWTIAIRDEIAAYLEAGRTFQVYRGTSWCRFFCRRKMGCRELTDGKWVWPEDLSHYVRDHNVRLPDEFVDHALAARGHSLDADHETSEVVLDETFWIAWCKATRNNSLDEKIQAARKIADAEVTKLRAAAIRELEQQEGVSDKICKWCGCNNLTLVGRVYCAACLPETSSRLIEPHMNLRSVLAPLLGVSKRDSE